VAREALVLKETEEGQIRAVLRSAPPDVATRLLMERLLWDLQGMFRGEARQKEDVQRWVDRYLIGLFNRGLFWSDKIRLVVTECEGTNVVLAWKLEPLPERA
jgi:hypothetical protein